MAEKPPSHARNHERNHDGKDKSPRAILHTVDQIHTKHRGDERRYHHDNRHRGEGTHHRVHVVVDDAAVGVHRRLKDVGVDGGGLSGLRHLDVDVLDEVGVQLVNLQLELQLRQQRLVATDGGLEIGQRVLQA